MLLIFLTQRRPYSINNTHVTHIGVQLLLTSFFAVNECQAICFLGIIAEKQAQFCKNAEITSKYY